MITTKLIEVPEGEERRIYEAMAYLLYVEQAIAVPTQLDGAYNDFYFAVSKIISHKDAKSIPTAAASFGTKLVAVIPGIVLASKT